MKKLCQFIICLTIEASLVLGVGRIAFAQNEPQAVPAPSSIIDSADDISQLMQEIREEIEDLTSEQKQIVENQAKYEERIEELGKFAIQYEKEVQQMARHFAECEDMKSDLEYNIATGNLAAGNIPESRQEIDKCFADAADERVALRAQNFHNYALREIEGLQRKLGTDEYKFRRVVARLNRLNNNITTLEMEMELSKQESVK